MIKIGIQGVKASFHDVAAQKFFATIQEIECPSFRDLCLKLRNREADYCIMAIENSIAGSILPNYSLLETFGFKIIGEVYLRIEMNLMALPGQKIDEIRLVQSHPMALLQCDEFLSEHPHMTVLEATDTADSAKDIRDRKLLGTAAIASRLAAETYGLEVLAAGIETNKQNYTRFLVICRKEDYRPASLANKSSIRFEAPDRPGSLGLVLECFSQHSTNMTKIQSVPILGRPYEYSFHVDLEWDNLTQYNVAMAAVKERVTNLIQFGEYPKGVRPSL
ncbi:prephenate dehydratase [Bdellovibrionota bacterium FG-2]